MKQPKFEYREFLFVYKLMIDVQKQFGNAGTTVLTTQCRQTTSRVSVRLPNGIDTEGRQIAGIDWSRGEVVVNVKGKPVAKFKTLAEAAPNYVGFLWALESTADSFELQKRQEDLDAIAVHDIRAYCFNSKYTSQFRIQWDDIKKSDEADAEVIRRIFTETKLACAPFRQIVEEDPLRDSIKKTIVEDRQYEGEKSIEVARKYLPSFKDVPEHLREFLYQPTTIKAKKPKNPTPKKQIGRLLMAAEQIRKAGGGFRTLRRQIGNYGQGYGSMLRSEYYYWLVRIVLNSRMKAAGLSRIAKDSHVDPKTKETKKVHVWTAEERRMNKVVMKQMQTVLKWLWKLTA